MRRLEVRVDAANENKVHLNPPPPSWVVWLCVRVWGGFIGSSGGYEAWSRVHFIRCFFPLVAPSPQGPFDACHAFSLLPFADLDIG